MKIKYIFISLICFMFGISFVNAKSIEYNLTIDKNLKFSENNIYTIKDSELDNSGNYDFMTSVVKEDIYFNTDTKVKYTKTKKHSGGVYTITLKNSYASIFLTGSRILNDCFSKIDYNDTSSSISIKTSTPFYCGHRADQIKINITTPLTVTSSNADTSSNGVYTWTPKDDDFSIDFSVKKPQLETEPMDHDGKEETADSNTDNTDNTDAIDIGEDADSNNNTGVIIAIVFVGASIILIIALIILKNKKNKLNRI